MMPINHSTIQASEPLLVFYDGECPLCSREIQEYRHQDVHGLLCFHDISAPGFDSSAFHLDPQALHTFFHVQTLSGATFIGVKAFQQIWLRLPAFAWVARLSSLPGVAWLLEGVYRCFARVRPLLPKRKDRCSVEGCGPLR
jgi:predicted DCC family thiol-disulfide oxidoreductase YuxK